MVGGEDYERNIDGMAMFESSGARWKVRVV